MIALNDSARLISFPADLHSGRRLVNLALGVYLRRQAQGWRRITQTVGSMFLIASPVLLVVAFAVEPQRSFHEEMHWSAAGLYTLFVGAQRMGAHLQTNKERVRAVLRLARVPQKSGPSCFRAGHPLEPFLRQEHSQIHHPHRIAPLIVIPGDHLHQVPAQHFGQI